MAEAKIPVAEMGEHSNIMGGSNAKQRINCPGSYRLEGEIPKGKASEYAEQGSVLHAAMEVLIAGECKQIDKAIADELIGQSFEYDEEFAVTADHITMKLQPALDEFWRICGEYDLDDWFIEEKVSLDSVVPGAFGTIDILGRDKHDRLHVLDWKFGDGVMVPAEGSYQLGFYALCALYDENPELVEFCKDIKGLVFHIVQPAIGANQIADTWETDEAWTEALLDQIIAARDIMETEDAPLKAGDHCRWCRAIATCPEQQKAAISALEGKPESGIDPVALAGMLQQADQLKAWITKVYDIAFHEMHDNHVAVPGYKLVKKKPRRQWTDEAAAEKVLRRKHKVGEIFTKSLISPTQAEKLDKALYGKSLANLVESRSSGLTVVDESDSRDAVTDVGSLIADALNQGKSKQETES